MEHWPDKERCRWQEAVYYYELGKFVQAKEKFRGILARMPSDGMAMYYVASCSFHLAQVDEAERLAREAVLHGADKEMSYALLGAICIEQKAYVEAEEWLLAALSENPNNAGLLAQYAYLMLQTGYEEKAKRLMAEAQRLGHDDETVLHYLYFFQRAYEQTDEQEETIRTCLTAGGNQADKLVKLGLLALDRHSYSAARHYFSRAYQLDPMNEALVQVLERLDQLIHPFSWPERLILRTGGAAVWWGLLMLLLLVLVKLQCHAFIGGTVLLSLLVCGYIWLIPFLYKWMCKKDRRG
ncbi:tetratricopeptide repeat protein [Brevibacillus sp. GCM10020057]|uniref:tetratricopeptide repeat protein n=1 Tax=Brevibacillus sp. GCM10020057 TaxID=3317327 RepID=UPI0036317FE7